MQVEMREMPLELRRIQLSLNYWVNINGHNADHPAQITLKSCWEKEKRETKSFGWAAIQKATEFKLTELKISPTTVPLSIVPPWILPEVKVDLFLLGMKNKDTGFVFDLYTVQEYIDNYYSYIQIYTDASKSLEFHILAAKRINVIMCQYTQEKC